MPVSRIEKLTETDRGSDMKRRDGNPEMDTQGSPERFPGPTDGPLHREGDTVVAVKMLTIFRLIPSPGDGL